jgi:hypothetical protein
MFQGGGLEQTLHRLQKKFGGKSWIHIETDQALALAFGQKSSKDWRDVSPTDRGGQIVKILGNQYSLSSFQATEFQLRFRTPCAEVSRGPQAFTARIALLCPEKSRNLDDATVRTAHFRPPVIQRERSRDWVLLFYPFE